jgi:hypothetical protein
MATIEDAKKCPKCDTPGERTGSHNGPKGSKVYNFNCTNQLCSWWGTGWIVQVHSDGSVPERPPGGPKEFDALPMFDSTRERVEEELRSQIEKETEPR